MVALATLPGCRGCRRTAQDEDQKEEEEEKKPPLQVGKLISLPHEPNPDFCPYKPGHWTAATLPARANHFDLLGDFEMTVVDRHGKPMQLLGMAYTSTGSRQVALSKGRAKALQSVLYVPATGRDAMLSSRINARKGGRLDHRASHPLRPMPSYQYHFVVLARWPLSYKYLTSLDCVKRPSNLVESGSDQGFYRIQLIRADKTTPLPSAGLFWTSIAYILWDDAEPVALRPEQETALLDWLHWGGQLIISGPESLDALQNSFLAPFLPATNGGTQKLTQADLEELNDRWTLPVHGRPGTRLVPVSPWTGVQLDLRSPARYVPGTGALLAERRVGRGRIVVSAIDLSTPELAKWPGFDGFFNACLLRRPPRRFEGAGFEVQAKWADGEFGPFDAEPVCKLRYFTRDTGRKTVVPSEHDVLAAFSGPVAGGDESLQPPGPDVAAWTDFNPVANSARESLQTAARIEIPDRMFVVWVVGGYLLVLVPANWVVFRSIRRVEWAWAAAPVIAVVYTWIVIRMAQLDIGFARSLTEIAVVELQGDYPRAHVTRYTALYTSLATGYEFEFEDPGAQVQPFPTVASPKEFTLLPGQALANLQYRYGNEVSMRGFRVRSNSTGFVHSEQMADLGGGISLAKTPGGGYQLVNRTSLTVHGAGVIRRNEQGNLQTAWVGTLEPQKAAILRFRSRPQTDVAGRLWGAERNRSPMTAAGGSPGELNLRALVDLAEDHEPLRPADRPGNSRGPSPDVPRSFRPGDPRELLPGDARLIGWLEEPIPGLGVKPSAPQSQHATLVVAHLHYGDGEAPQPDRNTRRDIQTDDYRAAGPGYLEDEMP